MQYSAMVQRYYYVVLLDGVIVLYYYIVLLQCAIGLCYCAGLQYCVIVLCYCAVLLDSVIVLYQSVLKVDKIYKNGEDVWPARIIWLSRSIFIVPFRICYFIYLSRYSRIYCLLFSPLLEKLGSTLYSCPIHGHSKLRAEYFSERFRRQVNLPKFMV